MLQKMSEEELSNSDLELKVNYRKITLKIFLIIKVVQSKQ